MSTGRCFASSVKRVISARITRKAAARLRSIRGAVNWYTVTISRPHRTPTPTIARYMCHTEGGAGRVTEVLGQVGKPYLKWKARGWAGQARKWTPGEVDRALELLLEADRQAKTGHADLAVLEGLLLQLETLKRGI